MPHPMTDPSRSSAPAPPRQPLPERAGRSEVAAANQPKLIDFPESLPVSSRRAEIEVTKLVGGSNAFVRRPFLYPG